MSISPMRGISLFFVAAIVITVVVEVVPMIAPTYNGRTRAQWLKFLGQEGVAPNDLLSLKRVSSDNGSDTAVFEVPILYDKLTDDIGRLFLTVDGQKVSQECFRATNGNCLLMWYKPYSAPGEHDVRAVLIVGGRYGMRALEEMGPLVSFSVTNLIQFDPVFGEYSYGGAHLYANLSSANATYTIKLQSSAGALVKLIEGKTTNGVINVLWDVYDTQGNLYTNRLLNGVFKVTLPDLRSETVTQQFWNRQVR